jgi:hypothetical protein
MKNRITISIIAMALIFASCSKKDSTTTVPLPTTVKTKSITVNFSSSSAYTFFSFRDTMVVANADSASAKWDFGLRFTTFIVNSYSSGPGNAGAILQDGLYDNVMGCPGSGFAYDTTTTQRAIKDGSWYDYNLTTHSFVPKAGKVFLFRTSDGHTFRYTYQPNSSNTF